MCESDILFHSTKSEKEIPTIRSMKDTSKEIRVFSDIKCEDSETNITLSIPCIIPCNIQACFDEGQSGADSLSQYMEDQEEKKTRVDDSPCAQEEQWLDREKEDGIEVRLQQEQGDDCKYNPAATMPSMIARSTMPEPLDNMSTSNLDYLKLVRHVEMDDGIYHVHDLYCACLLNLFK